MWYIGLNRRFWADMEYDKKIAAGRIEDIAPCTGCLECLSRVELGRPIRCRINAAFGRSYDFALTPAKRKKVIIIGGSLHGCETAEFLVKLGRKVTILETSETLGAGAPEVSRPRHLWWLAKNGVFLLSGVTILEITDKGVEFITKKGERQELTADTVMAVIPPAPNAALFETLQGKAPEVYLIGDAKEDPHSILGAVGDGAETARMI